MTDALIRDVVRLLHSRGREVTPSEVADWLDVTAERWNKGLERPPDNLIDAEMVARSVLLGNPMMTMCMHLKFGDAL